MSAADTQLGALPTNRGTVLVMAASHWTRQFDSKRRTCAVDRVNRPNAKNVGAKTPNFCVSLQYFVRQQTADKRNVTAD